MRGETKQIKILAAIGLALIAAVFIAFAVMPLRGGQRFATQARPAVEDVSEQEVKLYPVNINTATAAELQTLPGIGEKTAQKIIAYRQTHGKFKTKSELMQIDGIGEKTYAQIKDLICL